MSERPPYQRLMPMGPPGLEEICHCAEVDTIYLVFDFRENPLHCGICRGIVAPERIAFPLDLVDALADWTASFGAIYALWLQSGAYESWAYGELTDPDSAVHREGLALTRAISAHRPCAYLWFRYERRPERCPICASEFELLPHRFRHCAACHVLA